MERTLALPSFMPFLKKNVLGMKRAYEIKQVMTTENLE